MLGKIIDAMNLTPDVYLEELDSFLMQRNVLVHHFWNQFFSKAKEVDKAMKFVDGFIEMGEEINLFYEGYKAVMVIADASRKGLPSPFNTLSIEKKRALLHFNSRISRSGKKPN
jgi:hypothetical protein